MNLPELVQPVLVCFEDQDPRVRYYACESLYNISKVARGAVLVFFNNIFEGLCKVICGWLRSLIIFMLHNLLICIKIKDAWFVIFSNFS